MLRNSAFLLLACFAQLLAAHAVSAQNDRPVAAEMAPSAATAAEAYLETSSDQAQKMLDVMRAFMRDQKSLEKGMAIMYAVNSFEEHTAAEYNAARDAAAGSPVLLDALDAFREDQTTLAKRLMNSDEAGWQSILADTKRLSDRVRGVVSAPLDT